MDRITPKELQFRNPLDARESVRSRMRKARSSCFVCFEIVSLV